MAISLAALAAIGSLVGTGVSAAGSAAKNAEARGELRRSYDADMREYGRLLNRNYVDSPENAGLLRRLGELQRESYNRARATNVVAGGTDAHLAAMQGAGGKVVSDTAGQIAQRSQAYKDSVESQRRVRRGQHAQQMFGLDQQQAQTIANAGGQVSKAMAGIAAAGQTASNPYDLFGLGQPDPYMMGYAQANMDAVTDESMRQLETEQLQLALRDHDDDIIRFRKDATGK